MNTWTSKGTSILVLLITGVMQTVGGVAILAKLDDNQAAIIAASPILGTITTTPIMAMVLVVVMIVLFGLLLVRAMR